MPRNPPSSVRMTLSPAEVALVNELRANAVHYNAGLADAMRAVQATIDSQDQADPEHARTLHTLDLLMSDLTALRRTEA